MYYLNPEEGMVDAFLKDYPADTPVVMLNLLRFAEQAQYPENPVSYTHLTLPTTLPRCSCRWSP